MAVKRGVFICGILTMSILTTLFFVLCSFSTLGYNEVAINYGYLFKSIEDKTYNHGIWFIGLGH